jgi:hypothetical protein
MCTNIVRIVVLGLMMGICGCRSVPTGSASACATDSGAMSPSITTAAGEPAAWKIPPRPAEEMKQLAVLEEVTRLFTTTYASERARVQRSQGIVILVETARIIPSEYNNLRYAAHVPFMLFLKLYPLCGSPFDAANRSDIQKCLGLLKRADQSLAQTKLDEVQLVRQHRMIADAIAFLGQTLNAGRVEVEELRRYARAASVDVEQNMCEAGAAQVVGLHQQLLKWRKQIPDSEWEKVHFIVRGGQQPRGGNAATQYLSALLKDPGDGRGYIGESGRLVYREDTSLPATSTPAFPWEADLELLAAVDMDAVASEAMFSDPDRLAVDIAADGARARIRELDLSPLQPIGE